MLFMEHIGHHWSFSPFDFSRMTVRGTDLQVAILMWFTRLGLAAGRIHPRHMSIPVRHFQNSRQ
jgi:hypothetical protein